MIRVLFIQSQCVVGADVELHLQLMRYFDRRRVEVHCALTTVPTPPGKTDLHQEIASIDEIEVLRINFGEGEQNFGQSRFRKLLAMTLALPKLWRYIRLHGIDVLHGTEKPRDALAVVLLGRLTRARSVLHAHVSYGEWMNPIVKWALRNADAVIAVSEFSRKSFLDNGLRADRVHAVPNGLNLRGNRWTPQSASDVSDARDDLGIPPAAVVIGIVSRLFLFKGHLDLLESLAKVDAQMPDYRLVIVGEDDPQSHPRPTSFKAEIKERAIALGIADRLIFTGHRTDVPTLMAGFDIFTLPSREEPFGMVYLEAMALEKPVVAWNWAGAAEIVVDGVTGLLPTPLNHHELAQALLRLSTDAELRSQFGRAGRVLVTEKFESSRFCADIEQVYAAALTS